MSLSGAVDKGKGKGKGKAFKYRHRPITNLGRQSELDGQSQPRRLAAASSDWRLDGWSAKRGRGALAGDVGGA